ncbi:hypothetical protein B9479_005437 [Cryptococcus floricola]|uniref:Uncharacterized protein n=1 Tax=Cryptococcus floricola TaxID=2591691 RepID=A0A5D3AT50_9TREE|nr:hypothetical protein B9479_005437 [Cryptococcus floricola]
MRASFLVAFLALVATGVYSVPRPQLQPINETIKATECACAHPNQAAISVGTADSPADSVPTGIPTSEPDCPCAYDTTSQVIDASDYSAEPAVRALDPSLAESALSDQLTSGKSTDGTSASDAAAPGAGQSADMESLKKAGLALLASKYGSMLPSATPTAAAANLVQGGALPSGQNYDMEALKTAGLALLASKYGSMLPSAAPTAAAANLGQASASAGGQDIDMEALKKAGLALLASKYGTMLPSAALPSARDVPRAGPSGSSGASGQDVDMEALKTAGLALLASKYGSMLPSAAPTAAAANLGQGSASAGGQDIDMDTLKKAGLALLASKYGTMVPTAALPSARNVPSAAASFAQDFVDKYNEISAHAVDVWRSENSRGYVSELADDILNKTAVTGKYVLEGASHVLNKTASLTENTLDEALSLPSEELKLLGAPSPLQGTETDHLDSRFVDEILNETASFTGEVVDKAASLPAEELKLLKPSERGLGGIVNVSVELRDSDEEAGDADDEEQSGDHTSNAVGQKFPIYPPPGSWN